MAGLLLIFLTPTLGIEILCNPNLCPPIMVIPNQRGDGVCDLNCMNPYCNYDSTSNSSISTIIESSDCFEQCAFGTLITIRNHLGNGECEPFFNNSVCGNDLGDCGYCDIGCQKSQLGNECDSECNTTSCYYDHGACLECSPGCNLNIWGDGVCNEECNNSGCNYDNGDCFNITCAPDCYLWMIGNSKCDEACYVKECNFDYTDCDCFPECVIELLQNDVCDEACNNAECDFDSGNCGYCDSGCFLEMLRNDVCDEECNTYRCKYDNYACRCSLHCNPEDYGKCQPSCLVSDCKWDRISNDLNKWCYDEDLIKYTIIQQVYEGNVNSIVSFDRCLVASSYRCNLSMSLSSKPFPECNYRECNYGSIDKLDVCGLDRCARWEWESRIGENFCNNCYSFLSDYCSRIDFRGWYFYYEDEYIRSKLENFYIYYATSTQKGQNPSGNGTIIFPFETLDYALQSIYKLWNKKNYDFHYNKVSIVLYLYNDGIYQITDCYPFSLYESSFTISSYDKTQVLIKINGWSELSCSFSWNVKYENVIFDGSEQYSWCNNSIYCQYCSYNFYNESDGYYYNDRNQLIEENIHTDNCKLNLDKSLSLFMVSKALTLVNVEIRNFRFNYDSIISGFGKIELFNVTFDNIWLSGKEKNAVIYAYGDSLDFTYIGGSVSRLNNGFEIDDPLDFRGFLYSESFSTFVIKNVDFKYNLVYLKPQSSLSSASLIYFSDIDHFEISNCIFMYNYCETGIFYSPLNIESYHPIINETLYLTYTTISHIYIHDTLFISNYGKFGLIHIEFLGLLLNIHLQNLTINLNGAEIESLIYIYNSAVLDNYKTKTSQTVVLKNLKTISAISIPRWCKLIEISFKNNHAIGMINTINLVNLDLKNLDIASNGSPYEDQNINTLILDYFIENKDLYISKKKSDAQPIDCNFMASLSNPINLNMEDFNISNNVCRNSSPTFIALNSNSFALSSVICSENIGNGLLPICFYFTGSYDRNFTDSEFFGNINNYISGYGAIQIESGKKLYIANCSFINNTVAISPAIYFSGISMHIESSAFDSNEAREGNGGALYLISEFQIDQESSLIISSSNFTSNKANSNGGAIFLLQKSLSSGAINILISKTNFIENYAIYGSAFYIDKSVALSNSSIIIDSSFNENYSKQSGAIFLYFSSGILLFKSCEFIENSSFLAAVLDVDIAEDSKNLRSKINIEQSIFQKNIGHSVIYVGNQNKNSSIGTVNCIFEYNNARVVSLNFDYFSDNGSVFQFNSASYGSCFYLQNSAILYSSSRFLNNTSEEYGGAIAISLKSIFYCENCTFICNKAKTLGGALNAEQDSQFIISNTKFENNSCENDGSAVYAFNCNKETSSILLSQFFNNHASNVGVINLLSSKISIFYTIFRSNSASGYSSGLSLTFSNAEIYNSKFENQSSNLGNFIYLIAESNAYIKNVTFYNGKSIERGAAIFSSSSVLKINDSVFNKLSSPDGGAIYSTFDSQIFINSSKFFDVESSIEGGIISANQIDLFIENSNFIQFSHSGIYGSQIKKLEIINSSFSNGSGDNGGALYCDSCKVIQINLCTFSNSSASLYGGALFLKSNKETNSRATITSSEFLNNAAINGGGIYSNDVNLNIISSSFKQNTAFSGQDLTNVKVNSGIGGGINMNCANSKKCQFSITSSIFIENYAEYNGGGISWNDQSPSFFDNTYQNNSAKYGNDIASYPIKLMQVKADGSLANFHSRSILSDPISSLNLTEIASGQTIKNQLLVALVDELNNIISTDNVNEAELKSINLTTQISGITKVIAQNGIFNFSQFIISDEPGSDIQIMVTSSAIDISKMKYDSQNTYSKNLILNVNIRKCKIGEVKSGKNCEVCPEGFYSFNPDLISCLSCPDNAECYGNYTIVPHPGYWRDNMYTDKFWNCPHKAACLGSPNKINISYTGECGEGYKGNKCQSCKSGFSHNWNNKCEKCPENIKNILMLIGISTILIILLIIIIKASRKSALKPKSKLSIYYKIFLNYIQMVILASTFKLNWSPEVLSLFLVQNNADYVYQQIYSCQCLFESDDNDFVYFKVLITVALIPFFMLILSSLFWIIFKLIKRSYNTFWDDFISTCTILLFLIHPSIVKKMFASMNCTEINTGEYWLEEDLDIRCWNHDHIFYVTTVSLPTITLWGIILPTVCLVNIIRNKNKLNDLSVRLRYGFLFNGYKDNHFFWEFIILYSKIILICCSVFLVRISIKLQALIVAILYSIYLRLQYSNNPYTDNDLNQMELRAKIACAVTIWSGIYYLMGSLSDDAGYFFFAIIIIANCYFLIYWAFYLFKSISLSIIGKIKNFRKSKKVKNFSEENSFKCENLNSNFNRIEVSISSNSNLMNESQAINSRLSD